MKKILVFIKLNIINLLTVLFMLLFVISNLITGKDYTVFMVLVSSLMIYNTINYTRLWKKIDFTVTDNDIRREVFGLNAYDDEKNIPNKSTNEKYVIWILIVCSIAFLSCVVYEIIFL